MRLTFDKAIRACAITMFVAALFSLAFVSGCASGDGAEQAAASSQSELENSDGSKVQENTGFAMGTVVTQTIYSENETIPAEIIDILTQAEDKWISWRKRGSDVAKINANAIKGKSSKIAYETREILDKALAIAKDSDGAFEPSIGNLTRLWGFDEDKNVVPAEADIKKALAGVGYSKVAIKGDVLTMQKNAALDLGAIGKGVGADLAEQFFSDSADVSGALVNLGGSSILTYGQKNDGEDWRVAITNPSQADDFLGALKLEGINHISTSGDYEKFFEIDGKRYHHILDPSTGYPVDNGTRSVTIVCDSGAVSEGLSTACFVLGRDKSQALLKKYGAEAIFTDEQKQVYVTDGLRDRFELLADGYKMSEQFL